MHLLVTGATGLIGRRLVLDRLALGDRLTLVCRDVAAADRLFAVASNPSITLVEGDVSIPGAWQSAVDGVDAVIHLAGAGVADRRWSTSYKRLIERSRIDGTHQVVNAIEEARRRPLVLVSASAVGIYGDGGHRELTETAPPGEGFLAEVCVRWEEQSLRATTLGVRTVVPRFGAVLDERGGMVLRLAPLFRACAGGTIGSGRQYLSWIHWRDVLGIIDLALRAEACCGAINATAPNPVTSREFAQALGAILHRPALVRVPRLLARVLAGEFANVLAEGQRAIPARVLELGYRFVQPELRGALSSLFGGPSRIVAPAPIRPSIVTARVPTRAPVRPQVPGVTGDGSSSSARIRLLAVDVDGTLLRSDGRLSGRVLAALRRAEEAGCAVVMATARAPRGMIDLVEEAQLVSPTINFNGALIWNPIDERSQYHEPLAATVARAVVDAARVASPRVVVEVDVLDRCFADRIDPRFPPGSLRLTCPDAVGPLDTVLASAVTKLNFVGEPVEVARVAEVVRARFWSMREVSVFHSHPSLLQVLAPRVDKGIALQRIARRLNATREQVVAIGDASNDMGMIEWAGIGLAVANATPEVRALADAIVPANDENGVAFAIERYVLPTANRSPVRPRTPAGESGARTATDPVRE